MTVNDDAPVVEAPTNRIDNETVGIAALVATTGRETVTPVPSVTDGVAMVASAGIVPEAETPAP
jgi:hypothetical protein